MADPRAQAQKQSEKEKRYLEANDITMNMVAFMAPMGLFWSSLALQIGATDFQGRPTWSDMWLGVVLSGALSFITALSFSVLAVRYPRLGGIYDYCEAAFESSTVPVLRRAARPLQLAAFYGAVLLYWVYPSSVLAPVASNLGYLLTTGFRYAASLGLQMGIAVGVALAAGVVCVAGTRFSSDFNLGIVAIQVVAILLFSLVALAYRITNPRGLAEGDWAASLAATLAPTSVTSMLSQVTLAIVGYIGFESAVNFAPDTVDVVRFVPKGIYVSLGYPIILYALVYAAAKLALSNRIASADGALTGADALAASAAPVGDLSLEVGDALLGGHGYFFMPVICLGAVVALFGSYISSVNAGVKVTYQAAAGGSLPAVFRSLHPAYGTPEKAIWLCTALSIALALLGLSMPIFLGALTNASIYGTFLLYCVGCLANFAATYGKPGFSRLRNGWGALVGFALNLLFLVLAIVTPLAKGGTGAQSTYVALGIAGGLLAALALGVATTHSLRRRSQRAAQSAAIAAGRWRSRFRAHAAPAPGADQATVRVTKGKKGAPPDPFEPAWCHAIRWMAP